MIWAREEFGRMIDVKIVEKSVNNGGSYDLTVGTTFDIDIELCKRAGHDQPNGVILL